MAWAGESQEFHAEIANRKPFKGLALSSSVVGGLVPIHGAILEKCHTRRAGLPLLIAASSSCLQLTRGWNYYILFSFRVLFTVQVHFLYRGTLRVLLVLLHDFPEFLCGYHFTFCDVIPPSCIQMRNIILSAFPRNMRLPDPSTPNLKVSHNRKWLSMRCLVIKANHKRKSSFLFYACR